MKQKFKDFFKKIDKKIAIRTTLVLLLIALSITIVSIKIDNYKDTKNTVKDNVENDYVDDGNSTIGPLN